MNEMTWHDMKQNEIKYMKHMKLYIYKVSSKNM